MMIFFAIQRDKFSNYLDTRHSIQEGPPTRHSIQEGPPKALISPPKKPPPASGLGNVIISLVLLLGLTVGRALGLLVTAGAAVNNVKICQKSESLTHFNSEFKIVLLFIPSVKIDHVIA